jgi:hypothetical protein
MLIVTSYRNLIFEQDGSRYMERPRKDGDMAMKEQEEAVVLLPE